MSEEKKDVGPPPKKKRKLKIRSKRVDPLVLQTRRSIQVCASTKEIQKAFDLYDKARMSGIDIENNTFHCLLSLCCVDEEHERKLHVGTPRGKDQDAQKSSNTKAVTNEDMDSLRDDAVESKVKLSLKDRKKRAFEIKQRMDELGLQLNENGYASIIRLLCTVSNIDPKSISASDDLNYAYDFLGQAEASKDVRVKLRLYSPLLESYGLRSDLKMVLQLWKQIESQGLSITELEYQFMMKCAISVGDDVLVERLLSSIAEDIPIPSNDTLTIIISWFRDERSSSSSSSAESLWSSVAINSTESAPDVGPLISPTGWSIDLNCGIDVLTGRLKEGCLKDSFLQPVALSQKTWNDILDMNETIVKKGSVEGHLSEFQGGRKGKKRENEDVPKRISDWDQFKDWLQKHFGDLNSNGIDVVIDGANVGYFECNTKARKHVEYRQIDWVIQYFEKMGKKVLMFLHERHFSKKLMPKWAEPITKRWVEANIVYKTPFNANDDWYWLHAALYSGINTLVVTNDECRDHHFQMLAHRSFLRWKERHRITFSFGGFTGEEGTDREREVRLNFPKRYSRRIQRIHVENSIGGFVIPLVKKGDKDRFLDGEFIAETAPDEEMYACISAKSSS